MALISHAMSRAYAHVVSTQDTAVPESSNVLGYELESSPITRTLGKIADKSRTSGDQGGLIAKKRMRAHPFISGNRPTACGKRTPLLSNCGSRSKGGANHTTSATASVSFLESPLMAISSNSV